MLSTLICSLHILDMYGSITQYPVNMCNYYMSTKMFKAIRKESSLLGGNRPVSDKAEQEMLLATDRNPLRSVPKTNQHGTDTCLLAWTADQCLVNGKGREPFILLGGEWEDRFRLREVAGTR